MCKIIGVGMAFFFLIAIPYALYSVGGAGLLLLVIAIIIGMFVTACLVDDPEPEYTKSKTPDFWFEYDDNPKESEWVVDKYELTDEDLMYCNRANNIKFK